MTAHSSTYWLGVDTGGTFTDFVLLGDGAPRIHKVLSTPSAPEEAILQGIREMGLEDELRAGHLTLVHGTTVATNATLENKGARTVFITNEGLEDLLLIGRQNRAELYNLTPEVTESALHRLPSLGAPCRLDAEGKVVEALSEPDIETLVEQVKALDPESIAICLMFAFLDPTHERQLAEALQQAGYPVSCSHQVLPTRGEYERGMATWLNAWLAPRVADYLGRLERAISPAPLTIMQSHGGTVGVSQAAERSVNLLLSGPAGGLAAARRLGQQLERPRLMTFDMGGTSTDVALLDGDIRLTQQGRIGDYPVAVPMVDMHTIGAGGGSIAYVDEAGLLHVGPESAGADPGPASYGRGGEQVTVTDANVVLGRLQPAYSLGGSLTLDVKAAQRAMERLAKQLGMTPLEAAQGVIELANEHMTQALRVISIQKGFDPADFTLASFGGAGGLHVCALAENLGMCQALVPLRAGVLSAEGLVHAPRKREMIHALADDADAAEVKALIQTLRQRGEQELAAEGIDPGQLAHQVFLDMCYEGQSSVLQVPWQQDFQACETQFHERHQQRFGHRLGLPVRRVNVRVQCQATLASPAVPAIHGGSGEPEQPVTLADIDRAVPAYLRDNLKAKQIISGPALIFEAVGTTWLAEGWHAQVDDHGHLLLSR